jgi:predicted enzyme related to lactoylglutathione lyase
MPAGVVNWIELPSTDLEQSCEFYSRAFGWEITRHESWPDYPMWKDTKGEVGGAFRTGLKPMTEAGVLIHINVESIEAAFAAIEAAGGKPLHGKEFMSDDIGWWATFRDPSGNVLALFEPAKKE